MPFVLLFSISPTICEEDVSVICRVFACKSEKIYEANFTQKAFTLKHMTSTGELTSNGYKAIEIICAVLWDIPEVKRLPLTIWIVKCL